MIKFFRQIRQNMIKENKLSKYLLYAIGEIILVVIGILIALQINNANEEKKQRQKEVKYLRNIRNDLNINILELNKYIKRRETQIAAAISILEHYEGKPVEDYVEFNNNTINIYTWRKFFQNNNTFQELVNSGNLSLITNDSIKTKLLNLEMLYKITKDEEQHFRFDSEELLFKPYFAIVDTNPLVENFKYQVSNGKAGQNIEIPIKEIEKILGDLVQKNGFVMAAFEFGALKNQFELMKQKCEEIILLIEKEIADDD